VVDKKSKKIICTAIEKGRVHDFRLFKESKTAIHPSIETLTDSGYQGIQKIHVNCVKPVKGTKKKPLSKADKKHNHQVGTARVMVEHIIRELKIFKIIAAPYRNRRKRFGLRINLIAAIYNFEL
jgi:DDE superfamily endonuclease